jgi:hypothetical protein
MIEQNCYIVARSASILWFQAYSYIPVPFILWLGNAALLFLNFVITSHFDLWGMKLTEDKLALARMKKGSDRQYLILLSSRIAS